MTRQVGQLPDRMDRIPDRMDRYQKEWIGYQTGTGWKVYRQTEWTVYQTDGQFIRQMDSLPDMKDQVLPGLSELMSRCQ